jgi:hypothetical protein
METEIRANARIVTMRALARRAASARRNLKAINFGDIFLIFARDTRF